MDVTRSMMALTHARGAEPSRMEPVHALALRRLRLRTPYRAEAWETALRQTGLIALFPSIPSGLCEGFSVGYPTPSRVQIPLNSTSLSVYEHEFKDIVNKKLDKGRYIGPFPFSTIEALLGPFQSSPLSLIPKSGKPGKFRLVQNFSFLIKTSVRFLSASVNSTITSNLFPCTWKVFHNLSPDSVPTHRIPSRHKRRSGCYSLYSFTSHLFFSFLCHTHLLWGLYSYDWYHCMYLVGPTSFSLFLL
jgi:hypothetical protein